MAGSTSVLQLQGVRATEAQEALGVLSAGISIEDGERAAAVAMMCGALVERGLNPAPMAGPLLQRLRKIAPLARSLQAACVAQFPPGADEQLAQALERASFGTMP